MRKKKTLLILSVFIGLLALTGLMLLLDSAPAAAAAREIPFPDQRVSVRAAVSWLIENNQNEDGGYGVAAGKPASTPKSTLDAIMAIASAGYNPAAPYLGKSETPIGYLNANAVSLKTFAEGSGGRAGRVVLALTAASQNPRDFAANDWVLTLTDQISTSGQINTNDAFNQSLAILALTAVYEPVPENSVSWLKDEQADDGSWDDGSGTEQITDTTALSIMALVAAGVPRDDQAVVDGLDFLDESQLPTGGWKSSPDSESPESSNSTALVVQALAAAGEAFYMDDGSWSQGGRSPLSALLSWQNSSGAFQFDFGQGPVDDFEATIQAIPAATGKPLPLPARFEAAQQAVSCLATLQDEETGGWEQFAGVEVNAIGTSRAILAVAAVGQDPQSDDWTPGDVNAVEAMEALTPDSLANGRGGRTGVVIQGVVAAGDPYGAADFAGFDLPLKLSGYLSPTGEYDDTSFTVLAHDQAMLGLMAVGKPVDPSAVDFLLDAQVDGKWGDPDANGISLNVLGRLGISVPGAIDQLRETQTDDGGWANYFPPDPTASSEIVQGLVQNYENPFSPAWSKVVSGTITNAADMVLGQLGESGCWPNQWGSGEDPFSTADSVMLLVQQPDWGVRDAYLPMIASE